MIIRVNATVVKPFIRRFFPRGGFSPVAMTCRREEKIQPTVGMFFFVFFSPGEVTFLATHSMFPPVSVTFFFVPMQLIFYTCVDVSSFTNCIFNTNLKHSTAASAVTVAFKSCSNNVSVDISVHRVSWCPHLQKKHFYLPELMFYLWWCFYLFYFFSVFLSAAMICLQTVIMCSTFILLPAVFLHLWQRISHRPGPGKKIRFKY